MANVGNQKIAIVAYSYAIEVSPTIKNLCSYLYDKGYGIVDVIIDSYYLNKGLLLNGANIINLDIPISTKSMLWRSIKNNRRVKFAKLLKPFINNYSFVFAIDFIALDIIYSVGYDIRNAAFISLESIDYMLNYKPKYVAYLIDSCRFRVIQSSERAKDIIDYLGSNIDFDYLPVSHRPVGQNEKNFSGNLRLIYSGYFAEWACILELLKLYDKSKSYEISSLTLQGHAMGTETYLAAVTNEARKTHKAVIDTSFYDDRAYFEMISRQDVGVAMYKNISGTSNFDNMILSSGKISAYLWNGLAVITNIKTIATSKPPFIVIDNTDNSKLRNAIEMIASNRLDYIYSAYDLAYSKYNFDSHISLFIDKVI